VTAKPATMGHQPAITRVLLVEDNISDARLFREMLREAGSDRYVLETAGRLSDAIILIRKAPFDIVFLDLGLPDSQGMETLTTYLESAAEIPVIVLTGLADDAMSVQAIESGAQDFFVKGRIDGPTLVRAVRYAIGRKRQEGALRESEDRYRDLVEHSQELICTHDLEGRLLSVNPWAGEVLGYGTEELLRMNFRDLLVPEVRHEFEKYLDKIRTKGTARGLMFVQTRNGERRIWEYKNTLRTEGIAGPIVRGMAHDITESRKVESALRKSEDSLRLILESAGEGIYGIDLDGRCTVCNPSLLRLLGYRHAEDLLGKNMHALIHHTRSDGTPCPAESCRIIQAFHIREGIHVDDDVFWRADGTSIPVEYWSNPQMKGGEVVGAVVTFVDITERRSLESQLRQSQKMEVVGRLAGGVAHDFNNLLTVITGYSELLLQKIGKESPMHKEVEEIKRAGERAAALTQQLLAFSRKQVIEPNVLDLNLLMDNLGKMLVRLIGENIHLKIVPGKDLGLVKVDPGQFDQVLINLAVNARDAMPEGGTLLIETANVELDEEYCAQRPYEIHPGRYVRVAVSDTGHGMTEETRKQIFEPFFTTKEKGKGTGLGLSMAYGAVKQSGGSIEAYSELGIGTTFNIYLPRVEGDAMKPGEDERAAVLPEGTETVLVVEDDDVVRNLGVRILERLGYKVMQARNGDEAISLAAGYGERIDLLLADVVMPGMNGHEVATQLVLHHPEMEVLFMSGYTDDTITRHGVLDEGVSFVGKPYTPLALARKVREVLDKA
jgi:PAS domain S-box-containing protein